MTVDELTHWLNQVLKINDISVNVVQKFKDEEIDGKAFENMTVNELQHLLPDLKWGKCKNILVDRDRYIKKATTESKPLKTKKKNDEEKRFALLKKEECLRAFGRVRKLGDKYMYEAEIPEMGSRITDKISPIHKFVDLSRVKSKDLLQTLLKEMTEYASACMNERTNSTIHFGIKNRKIKGIEIDDVNKYSRAFTESIKTNFFEEQRGVAMRCIRPPQFIPVLGSNYDNSFVVEVDIVPSSNIIGNEGIFLRPPEVNGEAQLFRIDDNGNAVEIKHPQVQTFMNLKTALTAEREMAEKTTGNQSRSDPDIRRELQEFFCSGGDYLEGDIYPLLFLTPSDNDMDQKYLKKHFEFIKRLETRAIFDFDHKQESNSLASALTDQGEVFMTKLVDEFDDQRSDGIKRGIQKTFDDIKNSTIQAWIYCNGFAAKDILPLNAREWTMKQTKGFREILNFYKEQIPSGRARVVILLLSKEFDVLSEAVREICLLFQEQWIVLAENEGIATSWKETMLKYHSSCVDKATLDAKCHAGISWQMLNQTIIQFTGISKHITTEIPTQKGTFLKLPMRLKNELCDIQILSRNECEAEQVDENHQRDNEEAFYRGLQVSWWNFYYQGQVLVRKDHRVFLSWISDALKSSIGFGEKIPRAVIYHQPGAGGTTSARHVLWDLRTMYPCCLIRRVTDQTADQIQKLRTFANDGIPKPPVILLDNEDDESVDKLMDDLLKIAKDECCKVFCLLLMCSRQVQLPFEKCPVRMTLKHELTGEEKLWFEHKNQQLHDSFKGKTGIDPRFLIAFNIMKYNFNMEAIQRTVRDFVDDIPDREREFLLYLSLVNAYDLSYQPIPVACFDPLMCSTVQMKVPGKGWEQRLGQSIRVLLNRTQKPALGGYVVSFRVISQLLAKEILKCLMQVKSWNLVQTVCTFLESELFETRNAVNRMLFRCAASLMKRRPWMIKKEGDQEKAVQQFLAPILQDIYDDKNESGLIEVVELAYEVLEDPMVAQQATRVHIDLGHMERAETLIMKAIQQSPNNSYLHHTYGTLCRTQLLQIYRQALEQNKTFRLPLPDTLKGIQFAEKAIEIYKRVETITKQGSHGSAINPFGLTGILETVTYLLDTLSISQWFPQKEDLHRFLVQSDYFIQGIKVDPDRVKFLKSLQKLVDETLATLETDLNTATYENRSEQKNILSFVSTGSLEKLKINLANYFGENADEIPHSLSDKEKAAFRRNRTKTLGCASLSGIMKQRKKNMESVLKALNFACSNIDSKYGIGFDYLVAITCTIKLECSTGNKRRSEIPFVKCQLWSKNLFDCDKLSQTSSLEACLFIVLLNWPQSVETHNHPVTHDLLRSAMNDMLSRSESQSQRRKQTPLFFIGKEEEYKRIVLAHALKLCDKDKPKNPFRSRTAFERLRRFDGILENGGNTVFVNFQGSTVQGGLKIGLPTADRVPSRTMWNKRVTFVVGLGQFGIHVFDVTTDSSDELQKQMFEIQRRHFDTSKQQERPLVSSQISSDVFQYNDEMQRLHQRYWCIKEQRDNCQNMQKVFFQLTLHFYSKFHYKKSSVCIRMIVG